MKKLFAMALTALGALVAGAATSACVVVVVDEPTMPASMLDR